MTEGIYGGTDPRSLNFYGVVSQVINPVTFICSTLAGQGDNFFQNFDINVIRKSDGTGSAPQGDKVACASYISLTGQFTLRKAFDAVSIAVGDLIYAIHPFVSNNTIIADIPSDSVKQSSVAAVSTSALVPTKVKELAYTGKLGAVRVNFDLKVDSIGGIAYAIVYKNGLPIVTDPTATPIYTLYGNATTVYQTFTQDISGLIVGDLIQVYAYVSVAPRIAYMENFEICYDVANIPGTGIISEAVYFDEENGISGTDWYVGTASYPVNNTADLMDILVAKNLNTVVLVHGIIRLLSNMVGIKWIGNGFSDPGTLGIDNAIQLNGFDLIKCSYSDINIQNDSGASFGDLISSGSFTNCSIWAYDITDCLSFNKCTIGALHTIHGCSGFTDCSIVAGTIDGCVNFQNCSFIYAVTMHDSSVFFNCLVVPVTIDGCSYLKNCTIGATNFWDTRYVDNCLIAKAGGLQIDYTTFAFSSNALNLVGRAVTLTGVVTPGITHEISGDFGLTIHVSCTGGTINVRGNVRLTNAAGGATVNDYTNLTAIAALSTAALSAKLISKTIDLNQAAASYDLFTGTTQVVELEDLTIRISDTTVVGTPVTKISIQTDDTTPQVLINDTDGDVANLTAQAQLAWDSNGVMCYIAVGKKIQLTISGAAAGAARVCTVIAKYRAVVSGGSLA
jgi:hypothetical protein